MPLERAERLPPSEVFNLVTHAVGAVVAMVGLIWLLVRAESGVAFVAFTFYGLSLVLLFIASTFHHAFRTEPGRDSLLRRFDHIAIYLLIMGSYTPPCLLALPPTWGLPLLAAVWGFGLLGIVMKVLRPLAPPWMTVSLYIALGWAVVVAIVPVTQVTPPAGLALLVAGGLLYTIGAIVYATGRPNILPRYVGPHGLWHVMVLVAAGLHFLYVVSFVPPA